MTPEYAAIRTAKTMDPTAAKNPTISVLDTSLRYTAVIVQSM